MTIPWLDGLLTLSIEAALNTASGSFLLFDVGQFDVGTFGPDIVWADTSAYTRSFSTERKFSRDVVAWDPGTATVVLDNTKRYFSSSNLSSSSPFVVAGVSQIRPLRPLRIRATYAGVTYPLYQGYVQKWQETFVPGHVDGYVTVPCEDELSMLSAFDGLEQTPAGAGEYSGQRVNRVLDNAGYTGARNVDKGQVTVQATTLASNATTELKLTADSEGGALFIDADGTVCYEQAYALMDNPRSNTIQATFGDGSGSELPCSDIVTSAAEGDTVRNIASFARVGGTAQLAADTASRQIYRDRRESRTDLVCETDAQALSLAQFYVEQFKDAEERITQIQLRPRMNSALWPHALGRRVRDLIRVVVRPLGGGTITRDCHISGISHQVTGDDWVTTFDLASASVYQQFQNSRFDIGKFDQMTFFFGTG